MSALGRPDDAQVAIFGAGRIGKIHAGNLAAQPGVKLKVVVDPDAAAAAALAAKHGATVGTVEGVFADPSIRAVVIASSTDTHAELIERAAAAKKAIFCEKPVDLSYDRALRCARAVRDVRRPLPDRLPAPLRPDVRRGARADGRRRDRRSGDARR